MRKILRFLLLRPVYWLSRKFASRPDKERVFTALSDLYSNISGDKSKKGPVIPFHWKESRFIIFSDQHKGARNGADDFMTAAPNYREALEYYHRKDFMYINLGDCEELWENNIFQVKKHNRKEFEPERKFLEKKKYIKVFGNHDLFWDNSPFSVLQLKSIYGESIPVYEGVVLSTIIPDGNGQPLSIFMTHGHQGDASSDGSWFSKFFVSNIWAPLQALLRINPNTPAYDSMKKTLHNEIMYEWSSSRRNLLLITGHTHQPVFESMTHLERLYKNYQDPTIKDNKAEMENLLREIKRREREFKTVSADYLSMKPGYFNSGCCCFSDGDITGIEIEGGFIRLIKWTTGKGREVLEETGLPALAARLG